MVNYINAGNLTMDDLWLYTTNISSFSSFTIAAANSLPTTAAPTISPGSPINSDDITASVGSQADADSDPITIA